MLFETIALANYRVMFRHPCRSLRRAEIVDPSGIPDFITTLRFVMKSGIPLGSIGVATAGNRLRVGSESSGSTFFCLSIESVWSMVKCLAQWVNGS